MNFKNARATGDTENKYYDYYIAVSDSEKVSGRTYQKLSGSSYYFECNFSGSMPELDFDNHEVRQKTLDIAKYYIDLGVDGFRMDAVMHFSESDKNFNIDTISWFYDYCLTLDPEFYMVAEVWANQSTIQDYYASSIPSYFDFAFADSEGLLIRVGRGGSKAASFVAKMYEVQEAYSSSKADYIDAPFITNHDMGRVANALISNEQNLKMTAGLLMTMNGSPFVYYGEEIGMKSSGTKDENKRLPMIWSKEDKTGIPNKPSAADDGIESAFPGVDEQLENEYSLLNYYKRAVRIRNENPEIARGEIKVIDSLCVEHQAAITKTWEGSTIGIVYNTGAEELTVDLTGTDLEAMGIRGYLTTNGEVITLTDGKLVMPAKSICFLK
jgi:glycosidase